MAALSHVALLVGGCQQNCVLPVISHANNIAYCSSTAVYMYTPTTQTATTTATTTTTHCVYPLLRTYANGVVGTICSFDFNNEYVVCVTSNAKTVMWQLSDANLLSEKHLSTSLNDFFSREGGPCVVRAVGKYHFIYGTKTGLVVTGNMNDGTTIHKLRLGLTNKTVSTTTTAAAGAATATSTTPFVNDTSTDVGQVLIIDVSSLRPDTIAVGTSEGVLAIITLHPTNGLRQNISFCPFAVSTVVSDTTGVVRNANFGSGKGNVSSNEWLPVTAIAFDPNNENYIAVGSRDGALVLFDIATNTIAQTFDAQKIPVFSISWLTGRAGTFVTADGTSCKLLVWSVSNRSPTFAWNPVPGSALFGCSAFATGKLFLALRTGSVAVFNTETQQVEMQTEAGHTDTINFCRYSHHNKDLLASASTDGTIRVWNTMQFVLHSTIELGRVAVYSIDWSPSGKYIVAALSNGEVVCYHVSTQRENWRTIISSNSEVTFVSWSASESNNIIAASHSSGVTLLSSREGNIVRRYSTKSPVCCIDFDRKHAKSLAAGCKNGQVLVFSLSSGRDEPTLSLSGHSAAASNVLYNSTVSNMLLSCGHDNTLRLWDVSTTTSHTASVSARVLRGHTNHVTALAWCSLAPYLALSGSLDCTVRLWDVRNAVNLATVRVHNAAVRTLSSHCERPLVFASASLDSTIVFWHLDFLRQVYLEAALGTLETCILSDSNSLMTMPLSSEPSVMYVGGSAVQQLNQDLNNPSITPQKRMERLVGFFEFPYGAADLARAACFSCDSQESSNAKCTVFPVSSLVEVRGKLAKSIADKACGKAVANSGEEYRKTRLIAAAEEMLLVGKVSKYCQLMIEAKEWDSAIAAAPLISRDYWRSLCLQAAEAMEAVGDMRAVRYFIMAEECARAARLVARRSDKNWDAAVVIVQTCTQRTEQPAATESPPNTAVNTNGTSAVVSELLDSRATALAHSANSRIVAATKVVNGANDNAAMHLVHKGDVVIAHLLVHAVPLHQQTTIDAGYRLSMLQSCCQQRWGTALICATRQSNPYDGLATVLSFFQQAQGKRMSAADASYVVGAPPPPSPSPSPSPPPPPTSSSLPSGGGAAVRDKLMSFHRQLLEECQRLQLSLDTERIKQEHASDGLASVNQIAAMVLSPNKSIGVVTSDEVLQTMSNFIDSILQIALQDIDGLNAGFYLKQALAVTYYVSLPIQLQQENTKTAVLSTLSRSLIDAGDSATRHTAIMRKLLAQAFLVATLMFVKVYQFPKLISFSFTKGRELAEGDLSLLETFAKAQQVLGSYSPHSVNVDCTPFGAFIPSWNVDDGAQIKSVLTMEPLNGVAYVLEDGVSFIGKTEALQWMLCCAFSPLATGAKVLIV